MKSTRSLILPPPKNPGKNWGSLLGGPCPRAVFSHQMASGAPSRLTLHHRILRFRVFLEVKVMAIGKISNDYKRKHRIGVFR